MAIKSKYFLAFAFLLFPCEGISQLLFANRKDIRLVDAETRRKNSSRILISNLEDAAALDFYYADNTIFWADVGLEEIKSMDITKPKSNRSIISTGLISPDGLACDWLGKKLYWSDSETNRIEVSNFDGSNRKVLFWKDLDQPRAIALVPMDGWMFWTDWGESPKIEKAGMDGNHESRKVIVHTDIVWPNGIAADYDAKRIYWADAKLKFISSMNFDGKNRQIVANGDLPHPFALTLHHGMLYWTDWITRAVHACNKNTGCIKRTTFGGFLSPMGIHVYNQDRQPTNPTPCDINNGGCSNLCLLSPNEPHYACGCPTGVLLNSDGKTCADGPQELLLLVRRNDLRRISLDTPDFTDVVLDVVGIKHAIAVDYDPIDGHIYWTDDEARVIRRALLNGTAQEDLISTEVHHPDGIAVDWIAHNLYWTDTGTDRIEVSRLNGSSRKILITDNLDEPRAIVLDPAEGYMYWTDWGVNPKIEKAALDGSQRVVLVNTSLGWPNGLALDYEERKLYWGDAKSDKIEMSNLDGNDRRELVSDQVPHIFGFTLLGQYVYWTDWQRRSIERVDKITGVTRETIIDHLPDLMGLKAIRVKKAHGSNPCAVNNGNCTHLCLNRPGDNFTCSCPVGLELTSDNMTCVVPEAFLLFSRKEHIRRISLETNHDDVIPLSGIQEANALDYDLSDNRIYWTDTSLKTINRAFMNGSNIETIVEFGLTYPEGMAVDWLARNLYWTDMGSNRIEVSRLDGSSRKVLLWQNMDDPRSLALDPTEGYVYWSDWGTSGRIERAAMDGSHRKTIISKLGRPNGLTIDYLERKLYWIDINALKIEFSDLTGNNRVHVISENLFDPYGLTQYEDYIYWTDWKTNSIERANKENGGNRTVIKKQLDHVMDLLVYHTSRQSGWNQCAVNNGGCSNLCLAVPFTFQQKSLTHRCACPTHYSLASDNKTCQYPKSFMLFSQKNSINRFMVDTADSPDITLPIHGLKNIKALDYDPVDRFVYWIDGRAKTVKRSFINGTKVAAVVPNPTDLHPYDIAVDPYSRLLFWSCSQHNTINVTNLKGQIVGTVIGDEDDRPRYISLHPGKGLLFFVNMIHPPLIEKSNMDGLMRTVLVSTNLDRPVSLVVDVFDNYLFWGDFGFRKIERSSLMGTERKVIVTGEMLHPVSLTILGKYLYWIDQDQQSIEMCNKVSGTERKKIQTRIPLLTNLLAVNNLNLERFNNHPCAIKNGGCSHLCILNESGKKRCSCPIDLVLSTDGMTCIEIPICPVGQFRCLSGVSCLPEKWRCDGVSECEDMSDEMSCGECKPHQFRCQNGDCIDGKLRCDGKYQCKDYSDESCCQKNEFLCTTSYECISSSEVCDSKRDCADASDESGDTCHAITSQRHSSFGTENTLTIVISGIIILFVILLLLVFTKKCTTLCRRKTPNTEDIRDIMMTSKALNPQSSSGQRGAVAPSLQSSSDGFTSMRLSMPASSSSMYDRNHVTGASSSSSSRTYPQETLNPPPSPVTVRSQHLLGCSSHMSSLRSYKHYRSRNRPPPPTPCSTDVCDSESYHCSSYYCSSGMGMSYDSDPFIPPPPTPSRSMSDENYEVLLSCPRPPPPSPVPAN